MMLNVQNENSAVIELYNGYEVRQRFNPKCGRWYVWLPMRCGLRELFGNRDRMLRSHYVYLRTHGLTRVSKTHVVHHRDHCKTNDNCANLQLMTHGEHNAYHEQHSKDHPRAPSFLGRSHTPETIAKMVAVAQARGNNGVWAGPKQGHFDSTKRLMGEKSAGNRNAMYRHDLDTEAVRRCFEATGNLNATAKIFGCSVQTIRNRIALAKPSSDWKTLSDEELSAAYDLCDGNMHKLALTINAPNSSLWRKLTRIGKHHA